MDKNQGLTAALAAVQADLEHATRRSENPHFRSRYADLAAVIDVCRAPLARHGIAVVQLPSSSSSDLPSVSIETRIMHISGESITGTLTLPVARWDAQGIGSCITYGRRYALMAMLGIAADDDDGNAASIPHAPAHAPPREKAPTSETAPGEALEFARDVVASTTRAQLAAIAEMAMPAGLSERMNYACAALVAVRDEELGGDVVADARQRKAAAWLRAAAAP